MISPEELFGLLESPRIATRNNIEANCIFCGKSGHFFINKLNGLWDCKSCGRDGNLYTFLKQLGKLYLLGGSQVEFSQLKNKIKTVDEEEIVPHIIIPNVKLPIGFRRIHYNDDNEFSNYLRNRKFSQIDFKLYNPGYTNLKSKLKDYVVIGVELDFGLKGFVSRYINKIEDGEDKLRYINSSTKFSEVLFGYDEITPNTTALILVEGIFDKIGTTTELDLHLQESMKCCATFGKKISKEQINLIRQTNVKNIILLYDGRDALADMRKIVFELKKYFVVHAGFLKEKDPADSTQEELMQVLTNVQTAEQFWYDKLPKRKLRF